MDTLKKYSGIFFIVINTGILIITSYVYFLFSQKVIPSGFSEKHDTLIYYLKEKNNLLGALYLLIAVIGLILIKNKKQKIAATILIVIAMIVFNRIDPYSIL